MKPDLRDYFAVQFAAALAAEQRYGIEFIAGRAYDLAEAMLEERSRRLDAELADMAADERAHASMEPLLDEVSPPSERGDEIDPAWLEPRDEPGWERDDGPLFAAARRMADDATSSRRPGLAHTQPAPADEKRGRSTG